MGLQPAKNSLKVALLQTVPKLGYMQNVVSGRAPDFKTYAKLNM